MLRATGYADIPSHFVVQSGEVVVAPLMSALVRKTSAVDVEGLRWFLRTHELVRFGHTLYEDVRTLTPFERVTFGAKAVVRTKELPISSGARGEELPLDALVERFSEQLLLAISRSVDRARKVAVFVGGIDSSGLLAALCRVVSPEKVIAITHAYPDSDADPDEGYVAELCKRLGVRLRVIEHDPALCIEEFLVADEQPAASPLLPLERRAIAAALEAGADVAMGGGAGDTVLGGDLDEIATLPLRRSLPIALKLAVPWPMTPRQRLRWVVPHRAWRSLRALRPRSGKLAREYPVDLAPAQTAHERFVAALRNNDHVSALTYVRDQVIGALPIRWSEPLLDTSFLQHVASVPIDKLTCDFRFRGLYHRVIAPWVTERIAARRTKSYYPALKRYRDAQAPLLRSLLECTELRRAGIVEQSLVDTFEREEDPAWTWSYIAAEAWLRGRR